MEVMLPRSSPGAVNGRRWEITSRGQVGSTSGHLAAAISSEVTSNGGLDRIGSPNRTRRTSSPIEPTGSPTRRRINSPRAMPLLSVASLSASFHTDTTMSREMETTQLLPSRAAAFRSAGSSLSLPVSCISNDLLPKPASPSAVSPACTDFEVGLEQNPACWDSVPTLVEAESPVQAGSSHPLITVTINPLEQDEVTFIPNSPPMEVDTRGRDFFQERHLSIGSAGSLDTEGDDRNRLQAVGRGSFRRVSDISHIKQLRKEVPGFSHLASEYYEVREVDPDDSDNISLDSLHIRVLERCVTKYQPPDRTAYASKWFVVITTGLTLLSLSYIFWFKNFSEPVSSEEPH